MNTCKWTVSLALHSLWNSSISFLFLFLLFNGKRKVSAFSVETGVYLHSENVHITKSVEPAFEDGFVPESLNKTHKTSHKITKQQRKHLDEISQEKKKKKKKTKNDHEREKKLNATLHIRIGSTLGFVGIASRIHWDAFHRIFLVQREMSTIVIPWRSYSVHLKKVQVINSPKSWNKAVFFILTQRTVHAIWEHLS